MSDTFTEALIDTVRQYSLLYSVDNSDYKDLEKKNEAWREIGIKLQQDCDALKTRWRSLRDCYSKYKRTLRTTTGQAARKYKKWPWAEHMSFLDTATALRPTSSNIARTANSASTVTSTSTTTSPSTFTSTSSATTSLDVEVTDERESDQERNTDNSHIGCHKRQNKPVDPATAVVNYLKGRDSYRTNKVREKSDIDLLFKSYAESFKKFTPLTQARLKMKIAKLFSEEEIREIEHQQQQTTGYYCYTSAYSTINTDSPSPATSQSYIATPCPQTEDLSASRLEHEQSNGQDGLDLQLLNFQKPAAPTP